MSFQNRGQALIDAAVSHAYNTVVALNYTRSKKSGWDGQLRLSEIGRAAGFTFHLPRKWFFTRNLMYALEDRKLVQRIRLAGSERAKWKLKELILPTDKVISSAFNRTIGIHLIEEIKLHILYCLLANPSTYGIDRRVLETESGLELKTSGEHLGYIFWLPLQELIQEGRVSESPSRLITLNDKRLTY